MTYTLVGSLPSPFVRRLRLLMEHIPYEMRVIDIYSSPGAEEIHQLTPVHQIPVLLIDGKPLLDSRVIFNYLNRLHQFETLSVEDENMLSIIEGMLNGGVTSFLLMKKSGVTDPSVMYLKRQLDRIESTYDYLLPYMKTPAAKEWNFVNMTLFAGLDWMQFRDIHPVGQRQESKDFLALHAHRPVVQSTDPRKA